MGAENSKSDDSSTKPQKVSPPPEPAPPPAPEQHSSTLLNPIHNNAKSKAAGWLTPKASRSSIANEGRRPQIVDSHMTTGRTSRASAPPGQIQKSQSIPDDDEPPELTPEQKKVKKREEAKEEMIGRMNNFIKTAPSKVPDAAMSSLPRAAVVTEKMRAPEPERTTWRGKLGNSKAEALNRMKDKLETNEYLPPMTQDNVGGKVETSLGDTAET
eukprot:gene12619-15847_t